MALTVASIRLSQIMRETILQRLMDHAFGWREKQLAADERVLGDSVYEDLYPTSMQKRMSDFPDGFFRKTDNIAILFGEQRDILHFTRLRLSAYAHGSHEGTRSYDARDPLSIRYFDIYGRKMALSEEKSRTRSATKAALDACTTIKNLLEAWPEAAPFVSDFAARRPVLALTVSIRDLNSRLGLTGESEIKILSAGTTTKGKS